MKQLWK